MKDQKYEKHGKWEKSSKEEEHEKRRFFGEWRWPPPPFWKIVWVWVSPSPPCLFLFFLFSSGGGGMERGSSNLLPPSPLKRHTSLGFEFGMG